MCLSGHLDSMVGLFFGTDHEGFEKTYIFITKTTYTQHTSLSRPDRYTVKMGRVNVYNGTSIIMNQECMARIN